MGATSEEGLSPAPHLHPPTQHPCQGPGPVPSAHAAPCPARADQGSPSKDTLWPGVQHSAQPQVQKWSLRWAGSLGSGLAVSEGPQACQGGSPERSFWPIAPTWTQESGGWGPRSPGLAGWRALGRFLRCWGLSCRGPCGPLKSKALAVEERLESLRGSLCPEKQPGRSWEG